MDKKYIFLLSIFLFFVAAFTAEARQISFFDDIKEKYQDYEGNWHYLTNENLARYPTYLKTENSSYYIVQRGDDKLTVVKSLGSFNFRPFDISFTIEVPASGVVLISQTNGSGQRRIKIPESVKLTYKRLEWDNKLPIVILKNQTWNMTVLQSDYWYSKQNGNLWFNFKTANVTGLAADVNASFIFNSWVVDNATTAGWTSANISTNGYWSAYGGGSIGTPLNSSIHTNLSLYVDCESTSGTIQWGINRYGRFPNNSITGTWNGNTTLNTTAGQSWGNSCLFDGMNDYYNFGNDAILNPLNTIYIDVWVYPLTLPANMRIFSKDDGGANRIINLQINVAGTTRFEFWNNTDVLQSVLTPAGQVVALSWSHIRAKYNGTHLAVTVNGIETSTLAYGTIKSGTSNLNYGAYSDTSERFDGRIDEAVVSTSNDTNYSTSWNLSIYNQTASAGNIISAVRFNISYLNVLNNTANISARQNGTSSWTLINQSYVSNVWLNQTYWASTDFLIEGLGNGSARMFVVSGEVDEASIDLSGYVYNIYDAFVSGAQVELENTNTTLSDAGGYYNIANISAGSYNLRVKAAGYKNFFETITITGDTTKNIVLKEKDSEEETGIAMALLAIGVMIIISRRNR